MSIAILIPAISTAAGIIGTAWLTAAARKKLLIIFRQQMAGTLASAGVASPPLPSDGDFDRVRGIADAHIDDFLKNRLPQEMPMIGMFIGDKTIGQLKAVFMKELERIFPIVIHHYINGAADVAASQSSHVVALHLSEKELRPLLAKAFTAVYIKGAAFGLATGLAQLGIVHWLA